MWVGSLMGQRDIQVVAGEATRVTAIQNANSDLFNPGVAQHTGEENFS